MDYWEFFAADARRTGSELYGRLADGVVQDNNLRAIAARARKGQPHANLLFGAVHFLLLRGAAHPLRAFYPDLNEGRAEPGDPFPAFRDFVAANRTEIESLIAAHVTNTNEVGRSALLHPGFQYLAATSSTPLNLIEIGPSAGLNLIWDQYGVRYLEGDALRASIQPNAELVIECALRGILVPPTGPMPAVHHRIGLELNPVDLTNDADRDWLRALIWPDQVSRLTRLDKAIALFRTQSPEIHKGDALALLPDALRAMPEDEPVCIYHTIALYQFSRDMRQALEDILTLAALRRPVWRLSFEGVDTARYVLSLIRYHDGTREEQVLANAHPHGSWVEWLA